MTRSDYKSSNYYSCRRSMRHVTTTLERPKPRGVVFMMIVQTMMMMMTSNFTEAFSVIESHTLSFCSASPSFPPLCQSIGYSTFTNRRHKFMLLSSSNDEGMVDQHAEYGTNMDQDQMMESDMLIVVDQNDKIVDLQNLAVSKKKAHTFTPETPRGILHRAFSLFVFDSSSRLLLTQRARTKITFPSVWTNTACSHPLVGMESNKDDKGEGEVDVWPDCYPAMDGIKRAAVRKARHELGLDLRPYVDDIQFVSRFHYWASDVATHGKDAPWGEHELDYVLMVRLPVGSDDESREETGGDGRSTGRNTRSATPLVGSDKLLDPNPDEVGDLRFVTIDELKSMLYESENKEKFTWSPWFVGIMERGGFEWWEDLDNTLQGKNTNTDIVFFDPPEDFVASYNHADHDKSTGILLAASRQSEDQRRQTGKRSAAQLLANTEPREWVTIQGG